MIYLDNAATTKPFKEVVDAMQPFLTDTYGNPGSIYDIGRAANAAVHKARCQVASFVGASPDQVVFTSGGSEANTLAIVGTLQYLRTVGKNHIIVSAVEHDSVLHAAEYCVSAGFDVTLLPVDSSGAARVADLRESLTKDTGLVSIMYVNNETGTENNVSEIADICRQNGILFHTDCVQAAGCTHIDFDEIGCDMLSISSHKIHGPKGVGALVVKDKSVLQTPVIFGGKDQEYGIRGGTENVPGIVGFGEACRIFSEIEKTASIHTSVLKQMFYTRVVHHLKDNGFENIIHVNGDLVIKHGKTLNLRVDNVDGETLLLMLDSRGVCMSAGSACRSHNSEPSHVLLAMGIDPEDARSSVRVSFSVMNTSEEVERAALIFSECVNTLAKAASGVV